MPRPRTALVQDVKARLVVRLRDGFHRPGQRFFSNRDLARRFSVSYQTAHRLIAELEAEGWLTRRAAAGTFVAGRSEVWHGVELVFHERARRADSFGARLRQVLEEALQKEGVRHQTRWVAAGAEAKTVSPGWFPILWEQPGLAERLATARRYVVVLEDRTVRGIAASYADSVLVDDYSGGMAAGEWLRARVHGGRCAVFGGPKDDARYRLRLAGFLAAQPRARVVGAGTWYYEEALKTASKVLGYAGVFCANDRLAAAVIATARERGMALPELIGFDDAPVAERMNFTTIGMPWEDIAAAAVGIAQRRIGGDVRTAAGLVFAPRPVVRGR